MTWGIFKRDSVSDTFTKMQEDQLNEAAVSTVAKAHGFVKQTSGFKKGSFVHPKTGESITPLRGGDEFGHSRKDGSTVAAFKNKHTLEKHLADHGYKKESVETTGEQLDELSKTTLGNYYNAAKQDNRDHADSRRSGDNDEAKWAKDRMAKRTTGMAAAKKRLNKEEVVEVNGEQLDEMISEVLSADQDAGKWISDFVKSDNPKFAGKSPEKRKQMALAAYYAAQKKESTDYESFLVLDEATQGEIVKMGAKEIKHANMKDKQDEADVMEPHSEGEADFLDKHSVNVTDDPTQGKLDAGKVPSAAKPTGKGAGNYDGNSKLSDKDKASYKESVEAEDIIEDCITEEAACGSSKKGGKKTFSQFKKEMK